MSSRVVHVLDATTPPDAVEILAQVLPLAEHQLVTLGHRSTLQLMRHAGIQAEVTCLHSMGWADPTGWRGLRRLLEEHQPTHVHAWGIPAAMAATMARFKGKRIVTLADLPRSRHLQLLNFIHKGGLWASGRVGGGVSPCQWIVTTSWLKRELHSHSIAADAVTLVRPALAVPAHCNGSVRAELGLAPEDGPILLLGGDGGGEAMLAGAGVDPLKQGGRGGPRHDLGMWAAGILQQMFPRVRVVVREDPRGRQNAGLERLLNHMADEEVTVLAPPEWPWAKLLGVADALLVTPDGPFAAGSILHAFACRVPVVGTPVDSVREHVTDRQTGLIAPSIRAREIAAVLEAYLSDGTLREKLSQQAFQEAEAKHNAAALRQGYESAYA
ncbi:MAG TPA: glycosyltransferase family 4 protein [Phycisphaerae bacterium]|nr:glycosyltransferase family 4 protein [Phycisphaerae bacterium]